MKEFILTLEERQKGLEQGFRDFIHQKLVENGFNMSKSITIKCNPETRDIVYGQK